MDSSDSEGSHSASGSDSEPMSMSSSDVGSDSVITSISSAGNHPPDLHPQDDHEIQISGSLETIPSTDSESQEENVVVDMMMNQPTQAEEELAVENEYVEVIAIDTATASTSRGGGKQRGAVDLATLMDLYAFYNKLHHYQFANSMQAFYNRQVQVYRNYETDQDVDNKVCELYGNYVKVVENMVEFPTDPVDIEIFQRSSLIWCNKKYPNDNHDLQDFIDSSKQETGDDEMIKDSNDSHKQESDQDNDHGTIGDLKLKGPESSIKHETEDVDMKDSSGNYEDGGPSGS
ncbi:hypothetical protein LXL04_026721 [Taraxacum kok-saghyz]